MEATTGKHKFMKFTSVFCGVTLIVILTLQGKVGKDEVLHQFSQERSGSFVGDVFVDGPDG
jgi:hypothetical protein